MSNTVKTEGGTLEILAKELDDAKNDLSASLANLAASVTNVDRLTNEQVQRLGEHTLQEAFDAESSAAVVHAAYDEGYMQAVEDMHTTLTAYYKGLN